MKQIPRHESEPPIPTELIQMGTVVALLQAQDPERSPPPLTATSQEFIPETDAALPEIGGPDREPTALRISRTGVAERVLRLLGTAARAASSENPERGEVVLARPQESHPGLDEQVLDLIEDRFGLQRRETCSSTVVATDLLARDIYRWVERHRDAAARFGLRVEPDDGSLRMKSPRRRGV